MSFALQSTSVENEPASCYNLITRLLLNKQAAEGGKATMQKWEYITVLADSEHDKVQKVTSICIRLRVWRSHERNHLFDARREGRSACFGWTAYCSGITRMV